MPVTTHLPPHDIEILRRLAERKSKLALDPVNVERKRQWYRHDAGEAGRPMVLVEAWGVVPEPVLECEHPWARGVEAGLRFEQYQFDVIKDDHVIEPYVNTNWRIEASDYGVQSVQHTADNNGRLGARRWDPPLKDLDRDLDKLKPRTFSVDRQTTFDEMEKLETVFGASVPIRLRGGFWWTLGMTITAIDLIGMENLMLFMFDNPAGLHRLMAFLRDDHLACAEWFESNGLLSLNNENDYIGSGAMGYTHDLPGEGQPPGAPVRTRDQWVLLESQETVGVGPDQFEEFVFPYQLSIAQRFGKCYYGCCEPVHNRWHILKRLPNLARISVSPWADEAFMAEAVGNKVVYSRKPNPSLVSTGVFDEAAIRADIRKTLKAARNCRVELIMKDVHTLNGEPQRLARWVELAREVVDEGR